MTIHNIMDSPYIIPVIFDHLENPTSTTHAIIRENKILDSTIEQFKKLSALMKYHENRKEDYPLLQYGLKAYFETNLSSVFRELGIVAQDISMLDYGAGSGVVSEQFKKDNPMSFVTMVDKVSYCKGTLLYDFEKEPDWYVQYEKYFDLVILSEVLHCKTDKVQEYLIDSSHSMLNDKGKLLIIENIDHCMAWRIGKLKNGHYPIVGPGRVSELTIPRNFIITNNIKLGRHIAYLFQKT